jgi:hypothetical protein
MRYISFCGEKTPTKTKERVKNDAMERIYEG